MKNWVTIMHELKSKIVITPVMYARKKHRWLTLGVCAICLGTFLLTQGVLSAAKWADLNCYAPMLNARKRKYDIEEFDLFTLRGEIIIFLQVLVGE